MTLDPRCRIGKITPKDGSAVIIIPDIPERRRIAQSFELLVDYMPEEDMAGYFMVAWTYDGCYSDAYWISKESPVGPSMAPAYVSDVLRRSFIEDRVWS